MRIAIEQTPFDDDWHIGFGKYGPMYLVNPKLKTKVAVRNRARYLQIGLIRLVIGGSKIKSSK